MFQIYLLNANLINNATNKELLKTRNAKYVEEIIKFYLVVSNNFYQIKKNKKIKCVLNYLNLLIVTEI